MFNAHTTVPLPHGIRDITDLVKLNVSEERYQEAGVGGSADIYCGTYQPNNRRAIEVAIKCIRMSEMKNKDPEYKEKTRRRLIRELEIWKTLSNGNNIIELLGIIQGIGPFPSPVCELCTWDLQTYLERKTPPPKHIQMMTDTLRGLSFMHELKPSPIVHGDIKSHNILVTADEKAMICDFGRSRLPQTQPNEISQSSFGATLRYMSPEMFVSHISGPTTASDMWAYGCVALEILCRTQPYQDIENDYEVIEYIKKGRAPSDRPRGIRAALVNDSLWAALASCWQEQTWRPSSSVFLERLVQMLKNGEIPTSPALVDLFPLTIDGPIAPWPEELLDLKDFITIEKKNSMLISSLRSHAWRGTLAKTTRGKITRSTVVVKVPRLNVSPKQKELHDQLQHAIRKLLKHRYGVRHQNIIDILGIDTSFSPHPGFVLEYCARNNLYIYCEKHTSLDTDSTSRPSSPLANAYSLISDVLEGLRYMHNYPVPIPQGDLTPENILIDINGVAKIGLFSFGRAIAAIPAAAILTTSVGPLLPFRWMSPELLSSNAVPTAESDMWTMGCVCFWLLTGLRPYAGQIRDDFAGVESTRGVPPGDVARIDYADKLGDRRGPYSRRDSHWITNGIWTTISRCWSLDPLLRPSAAEFLRVLKSLSGREKKSWMPVGVSDLAGKIKAVDSIDDRVMYTKENTVWKQYEPGRRRFKEYEIWLNSVKSIYSPNWYTKKIRVIVKMAFHYPEQRQSELDERGYIPLIRHEVAICSQLQHPNLPKLLGIDTSIGKIPSMVFELFSERLLSSYCSGRELSFRESVIILQDIASALSYLHNHPNGQIAHGNITTLSIYVSPEGRAQLSNFTCAFQYASEHAPTAVPVSSVVATRDHVIDTHGPEYYKNEDENHVPIPTLPSDVWTFACIILQVFTGKRPFHPSTGTTELAKAGVLPYAVEEVSKLDNRLAPVIHRMFSKDPTARPLAREVSDVFASIDV